MAIPFYDHGAWKRTRHQSICNLTKVWNNPFPLPSPKPFLVAEAHVETSAAAQEPGPAKGKAKGPGKGPPGKAAGKKGAAQPAEATEVGLDRA